MSNHPVTVNIGKADMLTRLEDAMIARLKATTGGIFSIIEPFNDSIENFEFLSVHEAAVFTLFNGSSYSGVEDAPTSAYSPRRTINWQIFVLVRSLRNARDGAVSSNAAVRLALQGQSLVGATPLVPVSDRLDARIDGGWRFVMEFSHHIPALAAIQFEGGVRP